jgi:hypothetical protein
VYTSTEAHWRGYFGEVILSGNAAEIDAATRAAVAAVGRGESAAVARAAGKAAAKRFREGDTTLLGTRQQSAPSWSGPSVAAPGGDWPMQLATRLFAPPARWGWEAAPAPVAVPAPSEPAVRPVWIEPQRPDTSALRQARSRAVTRVVWRLAFTVIAVFAFTTYQVVIEQNVNQFGGDSAHQVYGVVLIVVAALFGLGVLRAVAGVQAASRNIRNFEQPYLATLAADRQRHQQAVQLWERTMRQHAADAAQAAQLAAQRANGPLWYPVAPASEPTRIDVFGGDPRRHGWASFLVTFGSAVVAGGGRLTVLDFTGQDVGGGLLQVARAAGTSTHRVDLDGPGGSLDLLQGMAERDIVDCLAQVLTARPDGDQREERALAADALRRVLPCLDGAVSFARLAAGIGVLRKGGGDGQLSPAELSRLSDLVGEIDQNEWTSRQLRFLGSQLDLLQEAAPTMAGDAPLWTFESVSVVATGGGRDHRKELVDRLLLGLAQRGMDGGGWSGGFLVVVGADHLGAATLRDLSEQARHHGVRLVLMIDQPQGDLEKTAGTGGVVCLMKMYNHRDASIAADFIGKGHRFVLNQVTRQVGTTFTDGGGDSFAATTNQGSSNKQRRSGTTGRGQGLNESRGHTWTGTRNWSNADNLSTSTASSRVYEFIVEPQEILGMPETSFILVDNSGQGRRVVMVDGNPGICLLDRVATYAAPAR